MIKKYLPRIRFFRELIDSLHRILSHIIQLENNQSIMKQEFEYKIQEAQNNHAIQLLQLRSFYTDLVDNNFQRKQKINDPIKKIVPKPFEEYLIDLEKLSPQVFPVWKQCFDEGTSSYFEEKDHSCSTWSNQYSVAFRSFVASYAKGRLLDQGCGMYGLPTYLEGYPEHLISAIEPLDPVVPINFEIVKGFAEFLPWPDSTFATIVNATSLDHVLCLETAINESHRVLSKNGLFLIWIASIKGAEPFNKNKYPIKSIDKYHLFHFEDKWFENLIINQFTIIEKLVFPTPSFAHVFYALRRN